LKWKVEVDCESEGYVRIGDKKGKREIVAVLVQEVPVEKVDSESRGYFLSGWAIRSLTL
jgi:hypothetical protein